MFRDGLQGRVPVLAPCVLALTAAMLSARYSYSAAFERPVHLAILTLLLLASGLVYLTRWETRGANVLLGAIPPRASDVLLRAVPKGNGETLARRLLFLVLAVVARTLLFWFVTHAIPCSREGISAFAPLIIALVDGQSPWHPHPRTRAAEPDDATTPTFLQRWQHLLHGMAWGIANKGAYDAPALSAESVCPAGLRWRLLVPLHQITILGLDTVIIVALSQLMMRSEDLRSTAKTLASTIFVSAASLLSVAAVSLVNPAFRDGALELHGIAIRDLLMDSLLLAVAALSLGYCLSLYRPANMALLVGASMFCTHQALQLFDSGGFETPVQFLIGFAMIGQVILLERQLAQDDRLHRHVFATYFAFGLAMLAAWLINPPSFLLGDHRHSQLGLRGVSDPWMEEAQQSKWLMQAVDRYKSRYGIPPPPNFDKWFDVAMSVDSVVFDTFDQIHDDLRPFWGLSPTTLRSRTAHLLAHPSLRVAGLRIRHGEVWLSQNISATHLWMMEANANMIRPFAQWLPDMDIAFNLDDECRVAVPHEEIDALKIHGNSARAWLIDAVEGPETVPLRKHFDKNAAARWEPRAELFDESVMSPFFTDYLRHNIYHGLVAPTCPPTSPARSWVWWNRKTACTACTSLHATTSSGVRLVTDWERASDPCHQPDLAHLSGFFAAPAPLVATTQLFPVFSQSKIKGFNDILVPSPWHFVDKTPYNPADDMPWEDKSNSVFWRGTPTDGHAHRGEWTSYLRARFVDSARRHHRATVRANATSSTFTVNATFVGPFEKCEGPGYGPDCADETRTFYPGPDGIPPEPVPFSAHLEHRHLIDLDGAGFSGRFLTFLRSRSLPYRAALFRSWIDERVHAWRHFVPLDYRLGDKGLWEVVRLFAEGGEDLAKQMADEGRERAAKVLRREDMQVYMFRLLLEWGRLVDENRETLGFG